VNPAGDPAIDGVSDFPRFWSRDHRALPGQTLTAHRVIDRSLHW
jgi:hypothetical protein